MAVEPRDLTRGSGSRYGAHIFAVGLKQHRNMSSGLGSTPDLDSTGGAALPCGAQLGNYRRCRPLNATVAMVPEQPIEALTGWLPTSLSPGQRA
jgi:hypothetical protein